MFDLGFGPQIRQIFLAVHPHRQTLMFSSTFPLQVERLASLLMQTPLEVVAGGQNSVSKTVEQLVEVVVEDERFKRLLFLIGCLNETERALVFSNEQNGAETVFGCLVERG
jgi:superfamily II DNA/RNA helicase